MIGTGVLRALVGTATAAVAAAIALAFVTIHPPPLKPKKRPAHAPLATVATPTPAATIAVPLTAPPPPPTSSDVGTAKPAPADPAAADDLTSLPIEDLRARANANEIAAMEELGRRLIQGAGVPKDPQAGAGWLLRAAELGSAQSAFNVGVMYERGFVVERDSTKAVEWYRKAADANLAVAKHNLALLLREGKGAPRDGKAAIELLRSAARQGMAASMFSLGDIYDRGDSAPRDATAALAWFAVAAEFERQANRGADTALARTANQRAQALQRTLTPAELAQAQELAQSEFKQIVEALAPPKPAPPPEPEPEPQTATSAPADATPPPPDDKIAAWPSTVVEQVRAVQQELFDLKLLRDRPDGNLGPVTRTAIRDFQKRTGLRQTGEASKEVYLALRLARAPSDAVGNSPLPAPPRTEPPKTEPPKPQTARIDLVPTDIPPPPTPAEFARAAPKPVSSIVDPPKPPMPPVVTDKPAASKVEIVPPPAPRIDIGRVEPPPSPPTSADVARAAAKADRDAWPANRIDQVKAIQGLLRELKFYSAAIDGVTSVATRAAIRDYERLAGLKETGEPTRALFDSLKEMRLLMAPKAGTAAN